MRNFALLAFAAALLTSAPANAQNFWNGPACILYSDSQTTSCGFLSFGQCEATASGRNARCVPNPYFTPYYNPDFVGAEREPYMGPPPRRRTWY